MVDQIFIAYSMYFYMVSFVTVSSRGGSFKLIHSPRNYTNPAMLTTGRVIWWVLLSSRRFPPADGLSRSLIVSISLLRRSPHSNICVDNIASNCHGSEYQGSFLYGVVANRMIVPRRNNRQMASFYFNVILSTFLWLAWSCFAMRVWRCRCSSDSHSFKKAHDLTVSKHNHYITGGIVSPPRHRYPVQSLISS